jgi:hypothetical protein
MTDVRIHLVLDIDITYYLDDLWHTPLGDLVDISNAEVDHIEAL